MKPLPWSYSALESFVNCARSYHAQRVKKTHKQTDTEQMLWGTRVHKAFEDRLNGGVDAKGKPRCPLPAELAQHEDFMLELEREPGNYFSCENKIGFNKSAQPCNWNVADIWSRNIIDYQKINGNRALVVDHKTGKPHNKFKQLSLYALHTFLTNPEVMAVTGKYYWTRTMTTTKREWGRDEIDKIWADFIPDLKRYREAFKLDHWPPTPSGLCPWCPVKECEHWKPRRY